MRKILPLIAVALFFLSYGIVKADTMNPSYFTEICEPGEMIVQCSFSSTEPFGPKTYNGCRKYENNPEYRHLVGHGSSFGGSNKYCIKLSSIDVVSSKIIPTYLITLTITLLLELGVLKSMGFISGRKQVFGITFINSFTVLLVTIFSIYLVPSSFPIRITTLLIIEMLVIILETIVASSFVYNTSFKNTLRPVAIANIVSFFFGGAILYLVLDFFPTVIYPMLLR